MSWRQLSRDKGYGHECRIRGGHLIALALNYRLERGDIHTDTALRLESGPDAGDASNVYAISDQKDTPHSIAKLYSRKFRRDLRPRPARPAMVRGLEVTVT
jgi:hypothetical protein